MGSGWSPASANASSKPCWRRNGATEPSSGWPLITPIRRWPSASRWLGGEPADLDVVDAERWHAGAVGPDVHDRHALAAEPDELVVVERGIDADQPVDAAVDRARRLEHLPAFPVCAEPDDDRVVAGLGEHRLDAGDDVREVPAVEHRHGDRDRPRAAGGEARGGGVGAVVELGGDPLDPLPGVAGDVGQAAQGAADRRHGHAGRCGDVLDRRSFAADRLQGDWHRIAQFGRSRRGDPHSGPGYAAR